MAGAGGKKNGKGISPSGSCPKPAKGATSAQANGNCQNKVPNIEKDLKKHLKDIVAKKVTMDDEEAKVNVKIMMETVDALVIAMKEECPLFKDLYSRQVYTGSYYEGLRVKAATEFDLNLVLMLPFNNGNIEIQTDKSTPAYVRYHLKEDLIMLLAKHLKWSIYQGQFEKLFDKERCLKKDAVQQWIQGTVTKALGSKHFKRPHSIKEVQPSASGPAFTIFIVTRDNKKIDVDLVPVINVETFPWPNGVVNNTRTQKLTAEEKKWFLVPKPLKLDNATKANQFWRMAFPEAEKALMKSMGCVKMLIKLFKLLRDEQDWKFIASYYIKTTFHHELCKRPTPDQWQENDLGKLFMMMLKIFKDRIETRKLPYYFQKNYNLLCQLEEVNSKNTANRIGKMIVKIEKDAENVLEFYGMKPNK